MQDGEGTYFCGMAPNTEHVCIVGEFKCGARHSCPEFSGKIGDLGRICAGSSRRRSVQIDKLQ